MWFKSKPQIPPKPKLAENIYRACKYGLYPIDTLGYRVSEHVVVRLVEGSYSPDWSVTVQVKSMDVYEGSSRYSEHWRVEGEDTREAIRSLFADIPDRLPPGYAVLSPIDLREQEIRKCLE